ncbi:hypothetical protein [Homoserinimonas hongtaonis]|uniref:hypothetical protein n=1 Tax=Homoserinimonas hongtaonis TaxID=2079791 RepID=UPI000D380C5B|nr:hypothetical protein [Salinibacterium hongtaonis]AWB89934.1 hypothetical protein C2138_10640 [Salinibacterium hongtaonis]
MKPEFMRLRRAIALAIATVVAATGLALLIPASAMAHHNTVRVSASCENYEWIITWTITNSERDKDETIIASNQLALVPVGMQIEAGATYTVTEKVSGPLSKTLTVKGYWPSSKATDTARSASISPRDFAGTCSRNDPAPSPTPQPSPSPSPSATPQPSVVPSLVASACVVRGGVATGSVTATVAGLPASGTFTATLHAGSRALDTATVTRSSPSATFTDLAPGDYTVSVKKNGSLVATSPTATLVDCTPPTPTPSPTPTPLPDSTGITTIAATPVDCVSGVPRSITVTVAGLTPGKSYTVAVVADDGTDTAAELVTGVATTSITFAGLSSPASYVAELRGDATTRSARSDTMALVPCLVASSVTRPPITLPAAVTAPTQTQSQALAATGASELIPLSLLAALLLTAGGVVVTARMRRLATPAVMHDA